MSDTGLLWLKSSTILVPATDESALWLAKKKNGATIMADVHEMRNGDFFRKWWSLVQYAFDEWSEHCLPMEYRGQPVLPNFERFRKDVTILAGFFLPVYNIKGELRVEAESLKWAKMSEERFGELYSATIDCLVKTVFDGKRCRRYSAQQLRAVHENIWNYTGNWSVPAKSAA